MPATPKSLRVSSARSWETTRASAAVPVASGWGLLLLYSWPLMVLPLLLLALVETDMVLL